ADAPAGGVVHRVGDGGRHADDPDLAETLGPDGAELIRLADEDDVEVGHVRVDRNQVVAEGRIGYATGLVVEDGLSSTVIPMPITAPPIIWLRASFSLRMRPASMADTIRAMRNTPRSASTRTSTNHAANEGVDQPPRLDHPVLQDEIELGRAAREVLSPGVGAHQRHRGDHSAGGNRQREGGSGRVIRCLDSGRSAGQPSSLPSRVGSRPAPRSGVDMTARYAVRCGRYVAQPMRSASETMIPSGPRT
ncbi:MAG: hypothetical protein QOK12_2192, partial [Mycobacterium sp.]|nr:hypothetical protein [Mycobacterium sp.]